jgi:nucleotidyltransferase/DNA polymerase involved in DNA repair
LYERVSKEVMDTLRRFCEELEQTGIDEAFMDVSLRAREIRGAVAFALEVKHAVKVNHGLTCSIGIGPNKSTAKIASDMQKPDGLTVVPFDSPSKFLAPLPVSVIPGIGKKSQVFLRERGIQTIAELQAVPGKQLMKWFGKTGVWLWGVAHGEEGMPVKPRDTPKSLSVERTFKSDVRDFGTVCTEASSASAELARRTRRAGFRYKVVGIKIRFQAFETFTRERTLATHAEGEKKLQETALALLKEFETRKEPVRLIGVRVSSLEPLGTRSSGTLDSWVD